MIFHQFTNFLIVTICKSSSDLPAGFFCLQIIIIIIIIMIINN